MSLIHSFGLLDLSADSASLLTIGRIPFSPLLGGFLGMCCRLQSDSFAISSQREIILLFLPMDNERSIDSRAFCFLDFFLFFFGVEIFGLGIVIFSRKACAL